MSYLDVATLAGQASSAAFPVWFSRRHDRFDIQSKMAHPVDM
jgi:hypothetical protein